MIKIIVLTAIFVLNGCSASPTTTTQLKSPPREANSLSESYMERSLNSKTLNVRCQMPAFCCIQYENVVVDGKERKVVKGLCVGI